MNMNSRLTMAAAFSALAFCLVAATLADAKSITLPTDAPALKASPLPGYAKAQTNCVACHSAEYMLYQPPTAPRAYWEAMVTRMKTVFKAPIDDADMPVIVDYLVKTYGNEQPK
jgi:sulfite dehydrogenase (cytochrome) subunit B